MIAFVNLLVYRPLAAGLGLPPLYGAVMLWITTVAVELGYLLYLGKNLTGKFTLKGIVLYRQRLPWWQYIVFIVLFLAWGFAIMGVLAPLSTHLRESLFSWVPASNAPLDPSMYSMAALLVMVVQAIILNPTGGAVEELYFRGYLLPRMTRLGVWAPVVSVIIWACTHIGQPWDIPGFISMFTPIAYFTW